MPDTRYDEAPVAESEEIVEEPPLFRVILHNDDYTTVDFVIWILVTIFNMPAEEAARVTEHVHVRGAGTAGVFTYEVAEMKVARTTALAREHEYPLLCTMEPDSPQ
jgi:ATP-dependent Clp protease adaptor protein ClpS